MNGKSCLIPLLDLSSINGAIENVNEWKIMFNPSIRPE